MKFETKYEKWVVMSSVFLLLLVCVTGIWVYIRLSNVATNIVENKPKDTRLLVLKELNTDLITAENYVFSYAFRDEDTILRSFYEVASDTKFKIGQLRRISSNDPYYERNIDTLQRIVEERFKTFEGIILVQNENRVDEAMQQVVSEVKSITSRKSIPKPAPTQLSERRKVFQRRRKQSETVTAAAIPSFSAKTINQELSEIRKDVVTQEQRKNAIKLALEQKNNRLLARFTRLVQTIENREKRAILKEVNVAQEAAEETKIVIGIFCLTSVLLICLVAYLMYNLIERTRATNLQLQIAKDKSDQLTASKSRFLANMSHEIRTPLNAIVGFAEQLNETGLKENQQRKVDIIQKSAEHLTQITSDILDISKINSGAIQLESIPVSISEEVRFVEQSMQELATANDNKLKIQLDADLPEFILGDALRLRQIIINLLSNAMKFTHNGTVKLSIKPSQQSATDMKLVIVVSDTGIGISAENLKRIFDEFEQAETSTTRDYGGTGLGLTITQNLVRLMDGEIHVKSEPGKGTTFKVTIPLKVAHASATPIPEEISDFPALKGKNILIVDDELYNRKLLRNMLSKWDTRITEAEDGEEALREVEQSDYDLILLDLRMPKLDGFRTRKAIQELGGSKAETPIVALTAALTNEERLQMFEDKWKGVLLKPLKARDLMNCLRPLFPAPQEMGSSLADDPDTDDQSNTLISLEPLREISGNDSKFYLDMLRTFHRTTKDGLLAINQSSKVKDWESMAEAAHKIASPVKHVQAQEAYELLKQLERAGRTNSVESSIYQQIKRLNESIEDVLHMIDLEIGKVE